MRKIVCAVALLLTIALLCSCGSVDVGEYGKSITEAYEKGYQAAVKEWELKAKEYYSEGYRAGRADAEAEAEKTAVSYDIAFSEGWELGEEAGREKEAEDVRFLAGLLFMEPGTLAGEYEDGYLTVEDIIGLYDRAAGKLLNYGLDG